MIGIYKITNPKGNVYIGQSTNIEKRFKHYKFKDCKRQRKLYNSILKYNVENHIFEIIEECNALDLTEREGYYQDFYNSIRKGLNCKRVTTKDKSGFMSEETKKRIGLANKGRIYSEEVLENIRRLRKERVVSDETKLKLSIAGKKRTDGLHLIKKAQESNKKKVLNLLTNEIYESCKEAAFKNNINVKTLSKKLSGLRNNNTNLIYLKNYANAEN